MSFAQLAEKDLAPALSQLSGLEFKLWILLQARDPFGNGLHVDLAELAAAIGCARDSARKALNKLEDGGWLKGELIRQRPYQRNVKKFEEKRHTNAEFSDCGAAISDTNAEFSDCGAAISDTNAEFSDCGAAISDTNAGFSTESTAESELQPPQKERNKEKRSLSKIEQLKNFLDELDPSERERFLKFCKEKANALPQPPQLLQSWMAAYQAPLWEAFREASTGNSQSERPDLVGRGGLISPTAAPYQSAAANDLQQQRKAPATTNNKRQKLEAKLSDRSLSDCDREKILAEAYYDRDLNSEDREWANQQLLEIRRKQILASYRQHSSD